MWRGRGRESVERQRGREVKKKKRDSRQDEKGMRDYSVLSMSALILVLGVET